MLGVFGRQMDVVVLACVVSVSVRFRSKEREMRVGLSLLRNHTETLATQAIVVWKYS